MNRHVTKRLVGLRVLTMVSFFHFCGVNNGITAVVATSGNLQPICLTPVLVKQAARFFHPLNWLDAWRARGWFSLVFQSGQAVRSASQNALGNVLEESLLFQVWANDSLKRMKSWTAPSGKDRLSGASQAQGAQPVQVDVSKPAVESEAFSYLKSLEDGAWISQQRQAWKPSDLDRFWDRSEFFWSHQRWKWRDGAPSQLSMQADSNAAPGEIRERFLRLMLRSVQLRNDENLTNGFRKKTGPALPDRFFYVPSAALNARGIGI